LQLKIKKKDVVVYIADYPAAGMMPLPVAACRRKMTYA
jgi:hypothetical protein